jgi:hypothetical protein
MKSRQVGQAATHLKEGVRAESHWQAPRSTPLEIPKYRQIYKDLLFSIKSGSFQPGDPAK